GRTILVSPDTPGRKQEIADRASFLPGTNDHHVGPLSRAVRVRADGSGEPSYVTNLLTGGIVGPLPPGRSFLVAEALLPSPGRSSRVGHFTDGRWPRGVSRRPAGSSARPASAPVVPWRWRPWRRPGRPAPWRPAQRPGLSGPLRWQSATPPRPAACCA